ncbi:tether containing UBX domain for GLUT4-like, partial [Limulus polyphemus]|uniref:Tether containing UBX domain for GLUT4-like n=1 Tax=Limulus polyphemus TaxID=6850 RepID=A0ABM1RZL4_LIMPO
MNSFFFLSDNLPDESYELTVEDVRYLLKDLKKQRQQLEERQLETKSMREALQMDRALRYKQTVIRIQFPDRLVLQCRFPSVEKGRQGYMQDVWRLDLVCVIYIYRIFGD